MPMYKVMRFPLNFHVNALIGTIGNPGWGPIESHRWIMGISEKSIDGSLNVPLPFNAGHGKIIENFMKL